MQIDNKYYKRKLFKPSDKTKYFNFRRLYYTAFLRVQDLLIINCNEKNGRGQTPHKCFLPMYEELTNEKSPDFTISDFTFSWD